MEFKNPQQVISHLDTKIAQSSCECMIANDPKKYHVACRSAVSTIAMCVELKRDAERQTSGSFGFWLQMTKDLYPTALV